MVAGIISQLKEASEALDNQITLAARCRTDDREARVNPANLGKLKFARMKIQAAITKLLEIT